MLKIGFPASNLLPLGIRSPAPSRGAWVAIQHAAALGIPLVVFPCGNYSRPPPLGFGAWVPAATAGLWASAFRWIPAQ